MRMNRLCLALGLGMILITASACSFTTAHISSLKLTQDREGKTEASSFGPHDTIYARALVSNVPSKVTVKLRFITEKVQGQPENAPVTQFDKSFDLPKDGEVTYFVSPPPVGWPAGKYRIEASMLIESGEQKDQKTATFTVSGD
jgi:hypothetical protein